MSRTFSSYCTFSPFCAVHRYVSVHLPYAIPVFEHRSDVWPITSELPSWCFAYDKEKDPTNVQPLIEYFRCKQAPSCSAFAMSLVRGASSMMWLTRDGQNPLQTGTQHRSWRNQTKEMTLCLSHKLGTADMSKAQQDISPVTYTSHHFITCHVTPDVILLKLWFTAAGHRQWLS